MVIFFELMDCPKWHLLCKESATVLVRKERLLLILEKGGVEMKILVAHDGSAHADKTLQEASRMALQMAAEITIITVAPDLCLT